MQDELREQVIAYFNKYMLRKSSLSSYLGISPQYLSDWLHKPELFMPVLPTTTKVA